MSNNNGGSAFPLAGHTRKYCEKTKDYIQDDGMTLRDYFAAKVLPSVYKSYTDYAESAGYDENWKMAVALDSYAMADAMLKAREVGE